MRARVLERDVSVHGPSGHPRHRESQADARVRPGVELLGLLERLEDPLERVLRDAGPRGR